ncbi:hypothetical protein N7492_006462 [Penicillium capsulatum]|uniref:Rhodopsin domain-containing protein n=1 Tax=Penicillium capsulatum TaxID=69766 RepID=A0A9W9I1B5_9EURO|nr:hypothetical protein N7492_006462 [Penicillium capsulatum]KAJ6116302.1 hypothetical protein N7512_006027 [Penicillium capsulatum]
MVGFNTNVDFNETRATGINVLGWAFTGVAIATVILKFFARIDKIKKLGWDDFFIFLSLAFSIVATAFVSYSVTLGLGRHTAAVIAEHGFERYKMAAKWQIIAFPFNIASFSFPNISISILINDLLDPNPLRQYLLLGMSVMQVVFAMISVFLVFFQCNPTQMLWNPTLGGTCWSPDVFDNFMYWVMAYTTVTDIVLAIVPIKAFWSLQMRMSTKLGLCVMMGLTLLSAIVTVVKATYLHLFSDHTDPLYNVVPLVLWGLVEQNVVIVAACIPTLRPFFRKVFTSGKGNTTGTASNSRSRSGSTFKLASNPVHNGSRRLPSVSEFPLEDPQATGHDTDSNHSQKGIWQTREVTVESDDEPDLEGAMGSQYKETIPVNLRRTR